MPKSYIAPALLSFALSMGLVPSANAQSMIEKPPTPAPMHEKQDPAVEKNLKVFDTLDFDVFSNQKWDRLKESHAPDIVVTWPDGHETKGIEKHIDDLKALFVGHGSPMNARLVNAYRSSAWHTDVSIRVTRKTVPVFLATNIVLVVSAAVLFLELPKGGVINAEDLGYSINLF